ncbi:hypothetical protein GGQ97_001008 [Sphingomonas kaistensis]|uniref:Rap1a immunity protein domain-containing protein n=1 Tax=Sphingomonas kaistensis TaxID=298708 RepID=A0A7X5Y7A8_9SPHN|nr:hypothetical protein [Sphingomonas kaistensis]NJC05215.1 hypothetical protein [Sphingomonas kaistensis]
MYRLLAVAVLLASAVPAAAAAPGAAENFLNRADRLLGKGPLALVDGDYKRLQREGKAAGSSIEAERVAAEKAGKPIKYCSPKPRADLGDREFLAALRKIPQAERQRLSLRAAMLQVLQRKYPCRR